MKTRILAATAAALLLAAPLGAPSPDGIAGPDAAAKGKHKDKGLQILAADYDAATGTATVEMRWHKQELRRPGDDEGHLVIYGETADGPVVAHDETVALDREHRIRHVIRLAPDERAKLAGADSVLVAATHKHDDDGGLYDRAWYDVETADGGAGRAAPRDTPACGGPFGPDGNYLGCSLRAANLAGVVLDRSNLYTADLSGANLTGASLVDTTLVQTKLVVANLTGADLTSAAMGSASLYGAVLTNATLSGALMQYVQVTYVHLDGAKLDHADLTGAFGTGALFAGANLSRAILHIADLETADLTGADVTNADLTAVDLDGANLTNANLTGSDVTDAHFDGARFCNTIMRDGTVNNADCPS